MTVVYIRYAIFYTVFNLFEIFYKKKQIMQKKLFNLIFSIDNKKE